MTGDRQYRTFGSELEVRSNSDGRTIYGIAVPWATPKRITGSLVEQFASGAFDHQLRSVRRIRFAREHVDLGGTLIGTMTDMRDDAAGLYVEMRASRTPLGDETVELAKDGALDFSIGFHERQNRRLPGGITERVSADLFEVAAVMEGAYGELATPAGVRSAAGQSLDSEEMQLRASAEEFLTGGGLPQLRDYDTESRAILLGIQF